MYKRHQGLQNSTQLIINRGFEYIGSDNFHFHLKFLRQIDAEKINLYNLNTPLIMKITISCFLISFSIISITFCQDVLGIDVSNWQGNIDWEQVKADGYTFAWAKSTEGMTYTDPMFVNNMENGLNANVVMGAYHFARPDNNTPQEDAANFLNVASAYIGNGFMPPVLDLENPYSGGQAICLRICLPQKN